MLKDGSGWGAMAGVSATYLAADGFTGAPAVTVTDPAQRSVWSDLGEHWIIRDQYFKPYPICRWAQPAVEAALSLVKTHQITATDIAEVHVHTFHEAARLATALPATTEQAQYSLPFPVAAALCRGQLTASEVTEALDDAGGLRIGAIATLIDVAGAALALLEVAPDRVATVELAYQSTRPARSGAYARRRHLRPRDHPLGCRPP